MRTTRNIEDDLIDQASKMTGIKEKTTLVKLGLEALIARESAKRLAKLGGSEKHVKQIPRRRGIQVGLGKGMGYIDVHLLASAILTGASLWTLDKRLDKAAEELHCKYR